MSRLAGVALALVACSSTAKPVTTERGPVMIVATDVAIASDEVTFVAGGRTIPGTFVHPTSGKHRTVVLMAGSGPTDRNWGSPLLPGDNGSAKLLAEALGHRGFAVLRFDKAATGGNKIDLTKLAFDTYVDEGRAALAFARTRPEVDPTQLYIAGHSEGGIHATRVALAEGTQIAGLVLLSAPGRSMVDVMMSQLGNQFAGAVTAKAIDQATADRELASLKAGFVDFLAGKDVDPRTVSSIPAVQGLVAQLVNPATAGLARPLFGFDLATVLGKVPTRVMIYNGAHDLQVDPELDARRLAAARPDALVVIAPEANHVLKHEVRPIAELRADLAAVQAGYNAPDATLDTASVEAIASWLAK
ncbi:MAG: alpha/beta fold hydrolase [Proteobacteria bacterium]|nr:alpha/beta fold hydrolase [Pseudomonadota bacterium]